jgi:hypothetical protein
VAVAGAASNHQAKVATMISHFCEMHHHPTPIGDDFVWPQDESTIGMFAKTCSTSQLNPKKHNPAITPSHPHALR